jgi:hypothetical protein
MADPVIGEAIRHVPFHKAAEWAGLWSGARERGMKADCPACGGEMALRVYPDHAWCFAGCGRFSAVRLLAVVWEMDFATTAHEMLEKAGYVRPDPMEVFTRTPSPEDPKTDDLADALRIWCEANCPDWGTRQYDPPTARVLARLLGALRAVRSEEECDLWLARAKEIMGKVLARPVAGNSLTVVKLYQGKESLLARTGRRRNKMKRTVSPLPGWKSLPRSAVVLGVKRQRIFQMIDEEGALEHVYLIEGEKDDTRPAAYLVSDVDLYRLRGLQLEQLLKAARAKGEEGQAEVAELQRQQDALHLDTVLLLHFQLTIAAEAAVAAGDKALAALLRKRAKGLEAAEDEAQAAAA